MSKVILLGYMGSGKSTIAKLLAKETQNQAYDLDAIIENEQKNTIKEIFKDKGEVYFRKLESDTLNSFLNQQDNFILSLGGGTPCYGNNMQMINQPNTQVFYLNASVNELFKRLVSEKANRPLIASLTDEELKEFIAKHLFERNVFYQQAQHIIPVDGKSPEAIASEIKTHLV